VSSLLIAALVSLPGCAAVEARRKLHKVVDDERLRMQAWFVAREHLVAACQPPMPDRCDSRLIKMTPFTNQIDDWEWHVLPPYLTIVSVHEKALRMLTPEPPAYIEYGIAAARFLADKVDSGTLSPEGFREALSQVWVWMGGEMRNHTALMVTSLREAEVADQKTRDTVGAIALGLAVVLGAAIVAASARPSYAPAVPLPAQAHQSPQSYIIGPPMRRVDCSYRRNPGGIIPSYVLVCD
jgi:hypothetical protein